MREDLHIRLVYVRGYYGCVNGTRCCLVYRIPQDEVPLGVNYHYPFSLLRLLQASPDIAAALEMVGTTIDSRPTNLASPERLYHL